MRATHIADTYSGKISLCSVKPDPLNHNMVYGRVVKDHRYTFGAPGYLHTASRVYIAAAQVTPV